MRARQLWWFPLCTHLAFAGGIAVSPPRFDILLTGPTAAESLRVVNLGETPLHLKVSVAHFGLDEENRLVSLPPTEQSADQWMVITPLEFVVEPQKSQTVRFAIRPRVKPQPGEHRAMIFLEEQPPEEKNLVMRNLARIGIGVYVNVPPVERRAQVHCVDVVWDGSQALGMLDVESLGNAHVRPAMTYILWPLHAFPGQPGTPLTRGPEGSLLTPPGALRAGDVPDIPVLPGTRRLIRFPLGALEAGEYWVELAGRVANEELAVALPLRVVR
ncbi:MAG: fimbria/pilus periplasmic chaperone [Thermoanaerobaculum sp.]|nr:fimbria/pilus periplasmic chaperone [Thermoanaerobaculum sp.]MDW7967981.1 fimbria/pilus periplasmic chaperone [Thermoanaerobaculum sp.]